MLPDLGGICQSILGLLFFATFFFECSNNWMQNNTEPVPLSVAVNMLSTSYFPFQPLELGCPFIFLSS